MDHNRIVLLVIVVEAKSLQHLSNRLDQLEARSGHAMRILQLAAKVYSDIIYIYDYICAFCFVVMFKA